MNLLNISVWEICVVLFVIYILTYSLVNRICTCIERVQAVDQLKKSFDNFVAAKAQSEEE